MSWFADIAGKAEDFLNKVDQGAATAFHKDETKKFAQPPIDALAKAPPSLRVAELSNFEKTEHHGPKPVVEKKASPVKKATAKSRVQASKIRNQEDDEKLMEFLNSSVDNAATPDKKDRVHLKSKSDDVVSIKIEQEILAKSANSQETIVAMEKSKSHEKLDISSMQTSPDTIKDNVTESTALELENKLLKKEMMSLNEELASAMKRATSSNNEMNAMRKQRSSQNGQLTSLEKLLRESENKQSDLLEAIKAKDSQIAVLRVRIEERDGELQSKLKQCETLEAQNDRLLKDHSDSSGLQSQALDCLKVKLSQTEHSLELEKQALRAANTEITERLSAMQDEHHNMSAALSTAHKQLANHKAKYDELNESFKDAKKLENESVTALNDYKQKAQRILQSKDKMISSLQQANANGDHASDLSSALIEIEEIRHERDHLKDELGQSTLRISNLQSEMLDVESSMQNELDGLHKQLEDSQQDISNLQANLKDLQDENVQLKSENRFAKDDMSNIKNSLQSRIKDRDLEIEKLRKQVAARSMSTSTEAELESRVHSLTESLIQKQTILEAMSTEKNSLSLQLERLEGEVKESRAYPRQPHSVIGINEADEVKAGVPVFLRESPFDGHITRKVKRVYNNLDIFSVRIGIFLRQYPIARLFILIYMLLLHLWVFIVLTTYTPEMHSSAENSPHPAPSLNS